MPVLKDAQRVLLYNSGPVAFLYDADNAERIKAVAPAILDGYDNEVAASLAADGLLVAYELTRPVSMDIEVALGAPLPPGAHGDSMWSAPQPAHLDLPSGKLRIESYDSLTIGAEDPTDEGAVVELPPGRYTLQLQRLDVDALEYAGGEPETRELITLAPRGDEAAPPAFLPLVPTKLPWIGRYRISDGLWHGEVVAAEKPFLTLNCDGAAARALDLWRGRRLEVQLGDARHEVVFIDRIDLQNKFYGPVYMRHDGTKWTLAPEVARRDGKFVLAYLARSPEAGELLTLWLQLPKLPPSSTPVTLRVLQSEAQRPPPPSTQWEAVGGAVRVPVLAYNSYGLVLGAGHEALAHLDARPGAILRVDFGSETRTLHLLREQQYVIDKRPPPAQNKAEVERLEAWVLRQALASLPSLLTSLKDDVQRILKQEEPIASSRGAPADVKAAKDKIEELSHYPSVAETPLAAALIRHWDDPNLQVLGVQPWKQLFPQIGNVGDTVLLERIQ